MSLLQDYNKAQSTKQQKNRSNTFEDILSAMSLTNQLQAKTTIGIENVVVTARLSQDLDIKKIAKRFPYTQYMPEKFPGVVMKMKSPSATIIFFRTGSVVCTGTRSEKTAKHVLELFATKLRKESKLENIKLFDVKIQNIVSSADFGKKIHLEQAAKNLPRSMYEPEQFPGIIHRMHYPKTVILLFASGKLVCTGGKTVDEIYNSVHTFRSLLEEKNLIVEDEK